MRFLFGLLIILITFCGKKDEKSYRENPQPPPETYTEPYINDSINDSDTTFPMFAEELEEFLKALKNEGKEKAISVGKKVGVITNEEEEKMFREEGYIYLKVVPKGDVFGIKPNDFPPSTKISNLEMTYLLIRVKVDEIKELKKVKSVLYYIPKGVSISKYVKFE